MPARCGWALGALGEDIPPPQAPTQALTRALGNHHGSAAGSPPLPRRLASSTSLCLSRFRPRGIRVRSELLESPRHKASQQPRAALVCSGQCSARLGGSVLSGPSFRELPPRPAPSSPQLRPATQPRWSRGQRAASPPPHPRSARCVHVVAARGPHAASPLPHHPSRMRAAAPEVRTPRRRCRTARESRTQPSSPPPEVPRRRQRRSQHTATPSRSLRSMSTDSATAAAATAAASAPLPQSSPALLATAHLP